LDLRGFTGDLASVLAHPEPGGDEPLAAVREIIADVRKRGDDALRDLTARFDGCRLDDLRVPPGDLAEALATLPPAFREALEFARAQITAYHRTQVESETRHEREGIHVRNLVRPVDRAGCYVPGGRAVYPSTVLMTVIPAQVAGVEQIALCVPPGPDGSVPQATLAAAALLAVDEVYRVGGAQAIAALAYGTESIRPVDVIVGPGNVYVTLAKREVAGVVGIESTAGPSELVVVADDSAPPEYVAIDLMAQAEHGPHGAALLVTWSESLADQVEAAITGLLAESPRRADIEATLAFGGKVVLVDGPEQAIAVSNVVAPEHLQLMNTDPEALVPLVRHAGAVFCGHFAPAPVGDYVAGVNHVLPTARTARFSSALRVANFTKHLHVVGLDESALARVAPYVVAFAETEGLEAHARSVRMRGART
ncbi:MAG TPA: histidinol dehydrogenase, partial [Acidimicrobiia bacterium]|nr:histidinol dehydrogenase [Acidimicrobiia bacterium]